MINQYNLNRIYEWPRLGRVLIIIGLCVLVFFLGYLLDSANLKRKLNTLQKEEQDLKTQFEALIFNETRIDEEISQLPNIKKILTEWERKIIGTSGLPELLNDILKIGTENHLQFDLFNPGTEVKEGNYYKIPIKIVIMGDYHQMGQFFSQIANMPWIIAIDHFTLTKNNIDQKSSKSMESTASLKMDLILDAYRLNETKK